MSANALVTKQLGLQPYLPIWQQMKTFTDQRNDKTQDELWLLEHPSVYTQGQAGKERHILQYNTIPIIHSDRGGQITYHGPGQLIGYLLMDIRRRNCGIRTLVQQIEQLLIDVLAQYSIEAVVHPGAPGVYVHDKKIASIGLRVKKGCTYHGFSLNIDMDLTPFNDINPCGFEALKMTQMREYIDDISLSEVADRLALAFTDYFRCK
jgi:lipoyl(octanoyl) transferase